MKHILHIILFTFILNLNLYSQQIEENNNVNEFNSEVGIVIGNPSALNILYAYHFDRFLIKASGNYLGELRGAQLDFGYKVYAEDFTYLAFSIAAGSSRYPRNNNIFGTTVDPGIWDYYSFNSLFNSKGFFVSLGISDGQGNLSSPRVNLQIGITYQFK